MSLESYPQRTTAQLRASIGAQAEALRGIVDALDPDEVLEGRVPTLWGEFDRIERLAAAAKILLARRVDDSRVWEREGHRSAVDYLGGEVGHLQGCESRRAEHVQEDRQACAHPGSAASR